MKKVLTVAIGILFAMFLQVQSIQAQEAKALNNNIELGVGQQESFEARLWCSFFRLFW